MTALLVGTQRDAIQGNPSHAFTQFLTLPVAASSKIFHGALVMLDLAVGGVKTCPTGAAGTFNGHQPIVGVCRGGIPKGGNAKTSDDADNSSGALGDVLALVETGIFTFANDGTTALAAAHIGAPCFCVDDATVSADPLDYNRPQAGIFLGLDLTTARPIVRVGVDPGPSRMHRLLANADLSALKNTTVKIASASGVGKFDSQATDTGLVSGILVNAPAAGAVAVVVTHGPAPAIAGAAGFVCGTELMVTTGGALIAATAAKVVVGMALETATNGQTRGVFVQPRQLAA